MTLWSLLRQVAARHFHHWRLTLQALMFCLLAKAQELFGPRDPRYSVTVTLADVPTPRVVSGPDHFEILFPSAYATDRLQVVYGIGHEVGHVICDSHAPFVTRIEEGACEINAIDSIGIQREWITAQYGAIPVGFPDPNPDYWYSEYLVFRLLDHDQKAIRKIRERQPQLSLASADLILECVPAVSRRLAEQLAVRLTTTTETNNV